MRVPLSWLKEFVEIEESARELGEMLTLQGLEVSECEAIRPRLDGVVTGRILSVDPHPGSDGLSVCRVDAGRDALKVVCGAPNLEPGAVVPVAAAGTVLPGGRAIQVAEIQGIVSEGMLCSERELELGEDHTGILLLPPGLAPGLGLVEALGLEDDVLEIEITPNRPDCLSVIGVAREIAARKGRRLRLPPVELEERGGDVEEAAGVEIQAPEACHRYVARVVEGIRVGPSPFPLRRRLHLVGLRAINNIVDVTNLVMWERGQPLHAFDLDRLEGRRIVVRRAAEGESMVTLDGERRRLTPEDLVICDAAVPVALAGIMGGLESEIQPGTTRLLLESAFFEPRGIRRTAKRLGISTEASYRFEREIDKEGVGTAADRACALMLGLAGGEVRRGAIDVYPVPYRPKRITVAVSRINELLGISLDREEVVRHLSCLEMEVEDGEGETIRVVPPAHRPDIGVANDLVEEVARLHGYDSIPTRMPRAPLSVVLPPPERRAEERVRDLLVGLGFSEAVHHSFSGRDRLEALGLSASDPRGRPVPLQNPLNEAQGFLRTTLVGSLLDTASRNQRQRNRNVRLFELGRVFLPAEGRALPEERKMLAGVMTGRRFPELWNQPSDELDLYDLKGVLEALARAFGMDGIEWISSAQNSSLHPGCSGDILMCGRKMGCGGQLHPRTAEAFGIEGNLFVFEIDFARLASFVDYRVLYRPYSRRPAVDRDVALLLDEAIPYSRVVEEIRRLADPRVKRIDLFDLYQGDPVPKGKKSMAFRLTYQDPSRNLTDEEVNKIQQDLLERLLPALNARLR